MARQKGAHVLYSEVPLEEGFAQIPNGGDHRHHQPEEGGMGGCPWMNGSDPSSRDDDGEDCSSEPALPRLMGADVGGQGMAPRSEEHTSELQSLRHLVC